MRFTELPLPPQAILLALALQRCYRRSPWWPVEELPDPVLVARSAAAAVVAVAVETF